MKDQPVCLAEDCPCIQLECPIRGNCVACVRHHRAHQRHLPECLQPVLREIITSLAKQVEFDVVDTRPTPDFWEQRAKMLENEGNAKA